MRWYGVSLQLQSPKRNETLAWTFFQTLQKAPETCKLRNINIRSNEFLFCSFFPWLTKLTNPKVSLLKLQNAFPRNLSKSRLSFFWSSSQSCPVFPFSNIGGSNSTFFALVLIISGDAYLPFSQQYNRMWVTYAYIVNHRGFSSPDRDRMIFCKQWRESDLKKVVRA